jgi:hypothetical protein
MTNELYHYGILGMHWGIRRYQNKDGTLTEAGKRRLEKADTKWAKKNTDKITTKAKKASQKELTAYGNELLKSEGAINKNGKISASTVNAYNQKMAELMSQKTSFITAPSGRVVSFVAKRGSIGVYMALSDSGYNSNEFKNGIWSSGKVAYRKQTVDKVNI